MATIYNKILIIIVESKEVGYWDKLKVRELLELLIIPYRDSVASISTDADVAYTENVLKISFDDVSSPSNHTPTTSSELLHLKTL